MISTASIKTERWSECGADRPILLPPITTAASPKPRKITRPCPRSPDSCDRQMLFTPSGNKELVNDVNYSDRPVAVIDAGPPGPADALDPLYEPVLVVDVEVIGEQSRLDPLSDQARWYRVGAIGDPDGAPFAHPGRIRHVIGQGSRRQGPKV